MKEGLTEGKPSGHEADNDCDSTRLGPVRQAYCFNAVAIRQADRLEAIDLAGLAGWAWRKWRLSERAVASPRGCVDRGQL